MTDEADKLSNPYRWDDRHPSPAIAREELHRRMVPALRDGRSFALVAGRGMGKSVFVAQLQERLADDPSVKTVLFDERPQPLEVAACTAQLAAALDETAAEASPAPLLKRFLARDGAPRLVLLYDEVDLYVARDSTVAVDFFAALENVRQTHAGKLGILVVGGVGVYHLDARVASPFLGRATSVQLEPFSLDELRQLAEPFAASGRPLDAATLEALRLLSGGNPLLVVYGLHHLFAEAAPSPAALRRVFTRFREDQHFFVESLYRGIGLEEEDTHGAGRLWRYLHENDPPYPTAELQESVGNGSPLRLGRAVRLLTASGLIRIHGTASDDPLYASCVPTVVRPPGLPESSRAHRAQQFDADLRRLLTRLVRWSLDFYVDRRGDRAPELVPEKVFSAFLAAGAEEAGWRVEREAARGPGYSDIQLSHPRFPSFSDAVIEVKVWPRAGYQNAHDQVVSYQVDGSGSEQALAVVMLSKPQADDWPSRYRADCLAGAAVTELDASDCPSTAILEAKRDDGAAVRHYLVELPKRL